MNLANNRTRWIKNIPVAAGIIGALALLYFFAPSEHRFYPRCLLHSLTGLNCPFCGCLRASHQLLHGNFQSALVLNPLFVLVLLPFVLFVFVSKMFNGGQKISDFVSSPTTVWVWLGIFVVFGIVRNLSAFSGMSL